VQQSGSELPKIETTFEHQLSKVDLLKKVVQDEKLVDSAVKVCVLIGNNDQIAESTLAQMVIERDEAIVAASAIVETPIECIKLEGPSLTLEKLLVVMSEKSGLSITAINDMVHPAIPNTYGAELLAVINAALLPPAEDAPLETLGRRLSFGGTTAAATVESRATEDLGTGNPRLKAFEN